MSEVNRSRKRGDEALLAAAVFTLVLAVALILGVRSAITPPEEHPKVDVERVLELIDQGKISGREAEYWEVSPQQ